LGIKKAVITAAGRGARLYPAADTVDKAMLPLVDRDGLAKPVIQVIAEEALDSGIEELSIVCAPGDEAQYVRRFELLRSNLLAAYPNVDWAQDQAERLSNLLRRTHFAVQDEALGYGHAVYCARDFVGREPFLLLLSDHLYVSHVKGQRCAQQVLELANREACSVAAVQSTREHLVGRYGTLSGKHVPNNPGVYQIERIIEKPSLSRAELELQTPGLRVGHYLCFFGMYALTPAVFDILEAAIRQGGNGKGDTQLTPALQELANRERYLALEVKGTRHDIGARLGLLQAQIAVGLAGRERDQVLMRIAELLSEANRGRHGTQATLPAQGNSNDSHGE
jgi:UTP--glucose-1-phosphate uridylyltransferase